jgi:EmrB/QacA subfamily drug resistance transporter
LQDKPSNKHILGVLFAGVLMGALDIAIVGPALRPIGEEFGADARGLQWVFTIYVLLNLVGVPLMAKLSDLYGRRSIYILDVLLFASGSLVAGLASSLEMLLLGRALQGLGAGGIFPVATAVIGDAFPPERRGGALGLIGAVWGLAFVLGPLVGVVLLGFGWRWIFFVNLPVALGVIIGAARVLPRARRAGPVRFDWLGMALLVVMLGSLTLGISQIDSRQLVASLTSLAVLPFLAVALTLVPAFWWVESRASDPVIRPALLRPRQLLLTDILSFGVGLGEASLVFIPGFAAVLLSLSAQASSATLLPIVLTMTVGTPLAGHLLDRVGSRLVVMAGGALLALGMLLLGAMVAGLASFIAAGIFVGAGLSCLLGAPMRYIVLNEAGSHDRAAAQAVLTVSKSVGQLFGGALLGAVIASVGGVQGYAAAYWAIGLIALLITAGSLFLKGKAAERATAVVEAPPAAASRH